jgi:methylphosphotriester-DNA--protein-cysteine methyltransferase
MYKVIKNGQMILTEIPGECAGILTQGIFGRLDCKIGAKAKKENRVFFATLEDAIKQGFRPCNNCKPIDQQDFEKIKSLVREPTLEEFYSRPRRKITVPKLKSNA